MLYLLDNRIEKLAPKSLQKQISIDSNLSTDDLWSLKPKWICMYLFHIEGTTFMDKSCFTSYKITNKLVKQLLSMTVYIPKCGKEDAAEYIFYHILWRKLWVWHERCGKSPNDEKFYFRCPKHCGTLSYEQEKEQKID